MAEQVRYLDKREELVAELQEVIRNVETGKTVGIAWVELHPNDGVSPQWFGLVQWAGGPFVGSILRAAVASLAYVMDRNLEDKEE